MMTYLIELLMIAIFFTGFIFWAVRWFCALIYGEKRYGVKDTLLEILECSLLVFIYVPIYNFVKDETITTFIFSCIANVSHYWRYLREKEMENLIKVLKK